ncbi:hypothetical protein KAK05_03825, partial [Candidatus Parcubacteria bacterium]|nr:hypothetical protein [Candidatus Parcubacteria bacterium]
KDLNGRRIIMDLDSTISWLITEHEEYFSTHISHDTYGHEKGLSRLKKIGGIHGIKARVAEETGVFMYISDLHTSMYAPPMVKKLLPKLLEEHGAEEVMREIAKQMNARHLIITNKEELDERYYAEN